MGGGDYWRDYLPSRVIASFSHWTRKKGRKAGYFWQEKNGLQFPPSLDSAGGRFAGEK
jgi:hypothetical protein